MHVGVCKLSIRILENQSLKGKRRVLNSVRSRVRNKFNVSIAEVGDNEAWQMSTLGITCVSNSSRQADDVIDEVIGYIEDLRADIEIVSVEHETMSGF